MVNAQTLIMNEVSNGPSGNMEYVEFVVIDSNVVYNCNGISNPPCIDIRGWIFDDNSGYHGASGIAAGCVRFSNDPFWSCIPVGTIILIYNNLDPNSSLPPNDLSMSDGNCRIVAPINNTTLFEANATTPGAAACSYPATGWSIGGNWNNTLFANTGDCARIVNLAGCEVFSVCWGAANTNTLIYFPGTAQDRVYYFANTLNNNPSNNLNWTNACADLTTCGSNLQTPGAPNNAANAAWINSFNNGCMPIPPLSVTSSFTLGSCSPCTALASVTATGSIAPFTFTWSPSPGGGQGTSNATGLCTGSYSCIVESVIGCKDTVVFNVSSGAALTTTINSINATCNGIANGSANVSLSGGVAPYSYTWSPNPLLGQGTSSVTGLSAQTYTVFVKDGLGCTTSATFSITEPSPITTAVTLTNVSCNGGSNGTAIINTSGGVGPYTYTWSPTGGNSASSVNLTAGIYTISVKDFNNCLVTATASINQPTPLTATVNITNASCGMANGSATVISSGGNSGHTYNWMPAGGTSSTTSGLISGNYSVTVTDNKGCITTVSVTINQPVTISTSFTTVNVSCSSGNNGSSTVSVQGGISPYSYTWSPSPGTGQGTTIVAGLTAQNYTVNVQDAVGCFTNFIVPITQPSPLNGITTATNVTCNGQSNAALSVSASGGTGSYSYLWLPASNTSSVITGLTPGNYSVIVSDVNSCSVIVTATVTEPPVLTGTITSNSITCFGAGNGQASVNVTGGTPGYSYTWLPIASTNSTVSNLSAGSYTVLVLDINNCAFSLPLTITDPPPLSVIATQTDVICFGGNNGEAHVNVVGGTAPYTYNWSGLGTTPNLTNLSAGNYTCIINDGNNCSYTTGITIIQPSIISVSVLNYTACSGTNINVSANANGGTAPYVFNWNGGTLQGQNITVIPTSNTVYSLVVTDANGCNSANMTSSVTVVSTPSITISDSKEICKGNSVSNSAINVGPSGLINYLWAPGGQTTSVISVSPSVTTVYTLTATGTTGLCNFNSILTTTIIVHENPVLSVSNSGLTGCAPLCVNFYDASTTAEGNIVSWTWDFSGGIPGTNEQNPTVCINEAGTFSVSHSVTNSYGCTTTLNNFAVATVYPKPAADFNHSPIKPIINNDAEVTFTDASHSANVIAWNWYFMNTAQYISNLQNPTFLYPEAGSYVVALVVKSDKGCLDTLLREIVIGEDFGLYVPNAFTPNGDGLNDKFQPKGFGIEKYQMYIFDRWGEKLFYTEEFESAWNGTYSGRGNTICENGVYTWMIIAVDVAGKKHERTGHVTLLK